MAHTCTLLCQSEFPSLNLKRSFNNLIIKSQSSWRWCRLCIAEGHVFLLEWLKPSNIIIHSCASNRPGCTELCNSLLSVLNVAFVDRFELLIIIKPQSQMQNLMANKVFLKHCRKRNRGILYFLGISQWQAMKLFLTISNGTQNVWRNAWRTTQAAGWGGREMLC